MPQRQWEQALQPFHRLDSSRGGQGHCGLGLAIVVHVARLHGGHLDCLYADGSDDLTVPGRFAIRLSLPMDLLVENVAKS
jgi:two-component system osmolarity sensor histidine kinase EnvZ